MYQWRFLVALTKPKNFLLILYVLLCNVIAFFIGYLFGYIFPLVIFGNLDEKISGGILFLIINIALTFILTSAFGEVILRSISFSRKKLINFNKKPNEDTMRIQALFDEVHAKAMEKSQACPRKMKLYLNLDENINACIIGVQTMVINKGVLSLSDNEIKGIIAHELGHATHSDSLLSVAKFSANAIITIAVYLFVGIFTILGYSAAIFNNEDGILGAISSIIFIKIFTSIIKFVYFIWILIGNLCESITSRSHEYSADEFAILVGEGEGLISALRKIDSTPMRKRRFYEGLFDSHPYTADRIARLSEKLSVEVKTDTNLLLTNQNLANKTMI